MYVHQFHIFIVDIYFNKNVLYKFIIKCAYRVEHVYLSYLYNFILTKRNESIAIVIVYGTKDFHGHLFKYYI